MTYHTPNSPATAKIEIKKSEFIAYAYPIASRDELMFHMEQLKQQYPDARHICYAYIIGNPANTTSAGFDDDGEPNGTAGRPILNVLQHKAIGNVVVFVVRYFGGIKLGAGGLTRAYSDATTEVVKALTLTPFIEKLSIRLMTSFAHEQHLRHLIQKHKGDIIKVDYQNEVTVLIEISQNDLNNLKESLSMFGMIID